MTTPNESRIAFENGRPVETADPDIYFDDHACESIDTQQRLAMAQFAATLAQAARNEAHISIITAIMSGTVCAAEYARHRGVSRQAVSRMVKRVMVQYPAIARVIHAGRYGRGWMEPRRAPRTCWKPDGTAARQAIECAKMCVGPTQLR